MALTSAPATNTRLQQRPQFDGVAVAKNPPSERLIVALDFPDARQALALIDKLEGATHWFKIGLELFIAEGIPLVEEVKRRGYSVFLDLKLHDIPNTVSSAVRSAAHLGVNMLTVHASGGSEMLTAAAEAAATSDDGPAILAVTVLTSMDSAQLEATGIAGGASAQVDRLGKMALACGVPGLVCSANEISGLRADLGQKPLLVIPGIRPKNSEAGDQKRVATPSAAIAAGASYLVVGRPITRAEDPAATALAILAEMAV